MPSADSKNRGSRKLKHRNKVAGGARNALWQKARAWEAASWRTKA